MSTETSIARWRVTVAVLLTMIASSGLLAQTQDDATNRAPDLGRDGLGVTLGAGSFTVGGGGDVIQAGQGFDVKLRYQSPIGVQLGIGLRSSSHSLDNVPDNYKLIELFLEPRFSLPFRSQRIQPFIGVRGARIWERSIESGAEYRATGWAGGGVLGINLQVSSQIEIETGFDLLALHFGDFDFDGDLSRETCAAEQRVLETALPQAVIACSLRGGNRGVQITPGTGLRNLGDRMRITHPNTARSGTSRGFWIGLGLKFRS